MKLKSSIVGVLMLLLSTNSSNEIHKGVFIDNCVQNVDFETTSGLTGRTNAAGEYTYRPGDTIRFFIGDKELGTTKAGELVTVFDFEYYSEVSLLLQSIDSDGNPNNCIQISDEDYQRISEAPFEINEIDGTSISFRKTYLQTIGRPLEKGDSAVKEHALEAFKGKLLKRYDDKLIPSLYEYIHIPDDMLGKNGDNIYQLNPNTHLQLQESRLRVHFLKNYAESFLSTERDVFEQSFKQRQLTHEKAKIKSQIFVDRVASAYGIIGLSKTSLADVQNLIKAKSLLPLQGVHIFDDAFKAEIFKVGRSHLKTVGKDIIKLPFDDSSDVMDRMVSNCIMLSPQDGLQCLATSVGEIGMAMQDIVKAGMDFKNVRRINAVDIALDYLRLYYYLDKQNRLLQIILQDISEETNSPHSFVNYDDSNIPYLELALDYITMKHFNIPTRVGAQIAYDSPTAMDLIVKYKATIEGMTSTFSDSFDAGFLASLGPDHLRIKTFIEPTPVENQYKACLTMTNNESALKNLNGQLNYVVDGNTFHSESITVNFFRSHGDSHTVCSSPFLWELDGSMLNRSTLKVSYDLSYDLAFIESLSKLQTGEKYFELSKKSVVDDLAKPIIKLEMTPGKFVKPGTEVTFDAYETLSSNEYDSFTYTWEYIPEQGGPDITFTTQRHGETMTFTAPDLPTDKAFFNLRFKVVATSGASGKESEKTVTIIVQDEQNSTIPGTVVSANGRIWMDRNLGASRVATSPTDSEAYGDLYQWGRGTDGHEKRTSSTISIQSTTDTPGHDSFIMVETYPWDWRTSSNNNLWQGESGINTPCPSGFRLPTASEWETELQSWSSDDIAGAFASPLKLVIGGYRNRQHGGIFMNYGYYWSSSVPDGDTASMLVFVSSAFIADGGLRSTGRSVRCIQD